MNKKVGEHLTMSIDDPLYVCGLKVERGYEEALKCKSSFKEKDTQ